MGWETGTKREFKFDPNSTENEGRWRLYDPKKIEKDSYFRRRSSTPGVSYVMGKAGGKGVIQAVRFDKDKFTEEKAAAWWAKNHGRDKLVFSDEGGKKAMEMTRIAAELVRVARHVRATKEHYDSVAEMPRGLQMQFGPMLDGGEVEVLMAPDGTTWASDLSENSVVSYKGRMMVWFKYGGPGLDRMKKMDEKVLVDFFNDQIKL